MMKEVDLAKASLEKAKEFEKINKNDKAIKEYDAAIKKFLSILKTNDEETIRGFLYEAYLAKGDLLKKVGFNKEALACYGAAANAGCLEAQERLKGSAAPNVTPLSPAQSGSGKTSPGLSRVSPRPSNNASPASSQPQSGSNTPVIGGKSSHTPPVTPVTPVATSVANSSQRGSGSAQSPSTSNIPATTPTVNVSAVQSKPSSSNNSTTQNGSTTSPVTKNTNASQPLVIFKQNPKPVALNFKFGADVKVENTAHLVWLLSQEKNKESKNCQKWISLALDIINLFAKQPVKQRPEITEVLALAEIDDDNISTELLEVFISPIKNGTLLKPSMLNGLAEVINHVNPALLDSDDFVQILRVLKDKLEVTHGQGSAKKLEHLLRSVSRLMTAMVDAGIKGLARKADHQPLYECLKNFKSHQNRRICFDTDLAMQALARLPNDESNLGSFLRRFYHVVKGVAYVGDSVVQLSPSALLESLGEFYKALKTQTTLKKDWYHDVRYAQFLIKWEHFDAFEEFLKSKELCRVEDFYFGILYELKEVVDTHRDETIQMAALEFISTLFTDPNLAKFENVRIGIIITLVDVVRERDPQLAKLAKHYLMSLAGSASVKDKPLFEVHLPDLNAIISKSHKIEKPVRNSLITAIQDHSNASLADKLNSLDRLITRGFEMDLPESVEKKCAMLRERILADQDIKDELATYIPIRGAYRITDDESFDMEEKAREFIKSQRRKLLLIGNAGGGKSTFNRYLLTQLWKEYQSGGVIPVFVSLPIMTDPVHNLMKEVLTECGFTAKEIDFLKENRELCIILDGYDEVNLTTNLYSTNKLGDWKQISIILSCRTQYLINFKNYNTFFVPSSGDKVQANLFQEVTVVPFSDAQIEAYIQKYIQLHKEAEWESAEEWVAHIKSIPGLRELIETPFLLMLTMDVLPELVARYETLTGAERVKMLQASLYDAFVENWFQREENKLLIKGQLPEDGHDIKEDFWEFGKALASEMHKQKQYQVYYAPTKSIFGNKSASGKKSPWADYFSNDNPAVVAARKACLLKKVGPQQWAFFHATFVDYFATKAMFDETMGDEFDAELEMVDEPALEPKKRVDDKVSAAQLAKKGNFSQQRNDTRGSDDADKNSGSYSNYNSSSKK